jgi:hypothetical protein
MNTQANSEQLTRLFLFAAWAVNNGWSNETVFSFVDMLTREWNEELFVTFEAAMKK